MTPQQVSALTDKQLQDAIAMIGDHVFAERFVREKNARAKGGAA
jgi:hypothetical protein